MTSQETLNLRIQHKIDTLENWKNCMKEILPGELIIATDGEGDQRRNYVFIGDGSTADKLVVSGRHKNIISDDYIKTLFGTKS